MTRMPNLDLNALSAAQQLVHDMIASGPRGVVQGPLKVWLQSPVLAEKAQALGAFCRYGTSLPPRLSELAIIVVGAHWQAGFEWWAHSALAEQAGIRPAAIEAIRIGADPQLTADDERCVHAFAHELVTKRRVSASTYANAKAVLGEATVIELVAILGYYSLISMTIVTFDVPMPDGIADPFADRPQLGNLDKL
jgi:4-carboxymuconolactone decarboxylase